MIAYRIRSIADGKEPSIESANFFEDMSRMTLLSFLQTSGYTLEYSYATNN